MPGQIPGHPFLGDQMGPYAQYRITLKLARFAYNWNVGILGLGKMENWVIVKFLLEEIK